MSRHTLHWFRKKGLRFHDNPALLHSVHNAASLRCVFFLDPWFATTSNVGINKWRFLLECLHDLDSTLRKYNSRLFVVRGQPTDVLPKLFKMWSTTCLSFEEDPEPFGRERDQNVKTMCEELGVEVIVRSSHTLYPPDLILERNGGPPLTYRQFQNLIGTLDLPPEPLARPEALPASPLDQDHEAKYGVPSLEQLGFETGKLGCSVWRGGETEALSRLECHLERKAWVASFGRPKMAPESLLASPNGLSPYLRFGCLSTRLFYYQLSRLYRKIKKTDPPPSLHGQLLWREFFYAGKTLDAGWKWDFEQAVPATVLRRDIAHKT